MKKLTTKRRREIEAEITEISDRIFSICEETGLCIDIAHYCGKKESPCIFYHDDNNDRLSHIGSREEVAGSLDSRKFHRAGGCE